MSVIGGLDEIAYIIPESLHVHGKRVRMYAIFYDYGSQCYVSINMASQGRIPPKNKNSWMYLEHPDKDNEKWYKFQYSYLKNISESDDPMDFIINDFLPRKIARDAKKEKGKKTISKWTPWKPTEEEKQFLMAHIHRWQFEHKITRYSEKCMSKPPERNFSCEMKHGGTRWSCDQDYSKNGEKCTDLQDEDCLPNCYWDTVRRKCDDLPNDKEVKKRSKYKTGRNEKRYDQESFLTSLGKSLMSPESTTKTKVYEEINDIHVDSIESIESMSNRDIEAALEDMFDF